MPAGYNEGSPCASTPATAGTRSVPYYLGFVGLAATDELRKSPNGFVPILAEYGDLLRTRRLLADSLAPTAFALLMSATGSAAFRGRNLVRRVRILVMERIASAASWKSSAPGQTATPRWPDEAANAIQSRSFPAAATCSGHRGIGAMAR